MVKDRGSFMKDLAPSALAAALLLWAASATHAEGTEPQLIGEFSGWSAYAYKTSDTKVCYVSARPADSEPKNVKRDPAFFLVTNMPGRKVRGEVSTIIGYPFKKETSAEIAIDEATFTLFTNADGAWADTPATEKQIVAAMKAGKSLKVKGTSWRGTQTQDTYSLEGISAALAAIDKACN
jgi:invasion protein IalB